MVWGRPCGSRERSWARTRAIQPLVTLLSQPLVQRAPRGSHTQHTAYIQGGWAGSQNARNRAPPTPCPTHAEHARAQHSRRARGSRGFGEESQKVSAGRLSDCAARSYCAATFHRRTVSLSLSLTLSLSFSRLVRRPPSQRVPLRQHAACPVDARAREASNLEPSSRTIRRLRPPRD